MTLEQAIAAVEQEPLPSEFQSPEWHDSVFKTLTLEVFKVTKRNIIARLRALEQKEKP